MMVLDDGHFASKSSSHLFLFEPAFSALTLFGVRMDELQHSADESWQHNHFMKWTAVEWAFLLVLGSFLTVSWLLILPIFVPSVIAYPWQLPESKSQRERDKKRTVVMAGSFNPPHLGHLAMLEYLSRR